MPLYEYKCPKCGYYDDYILPLEHAKVPHCPRCKGRMRKVFPNVSIHMFPDFTQKKHAGIGERVNSKHHLKEVMKAKEEAYEKRVGIPIKYEIP